MANLTFINGHSGTAWERNRSEMIRKQEQKRFMSCKRGKYEVRMGLFMPLSTRELHKLTPDVGFEYGWGQSVCNGC